MLPAAFRDLCLSDLLLNLKVNLLSCCPASIGRVSVSYTHLDVYKRQEFINTITSSVNSLAAMQLSVDSFDLITVQLLSAKLDYTTFKLWKESIDPDNLPNFQGFT